jgi:hypothetical protein
MSPLFKVGSKIKIMLYKVTVKTNLNSNGVRLEKGMSVEVASQSYSLLSTLQGKELVNNAFKAKYGVDVKKACALTSLYLDMVKIN